MKGKNAIAEIYRVTIWGTAGNLLLAGCKTAAGIIGGSAAVLTDGLHSLSDLATDGAVFAGAKLSEKAPDKMHPYGHRWWETLSTLAISLVLFAAGLGAVVKAFSSGKVSSFESPGLVYAVTLFSIGVKEALFRITERAGRKTSSSALHANAWHHRSDAMSSIAVLGGLIMTNMGIAYADSIAAGLVGLMIIIAALKLIGGVFREFSNTAAGRKTLETVKKISREDPEVGQIHKLRSRNIGREIFLDFHMLVDPQMSVRKAHEITDRIEKKISESLTVPVNITIHIEPDLEDKRKDE
ncbi:cation diffusion facilitator family transporter [Sedimentisphaera salicampi]|uniref:cation diffusion facilitator family transporter n=1 Tax=Sedimentisphaera salicampi TaxID=1941349 RepID=UPI000B9C6AC0|nr:cation diffusion facilitator family transporter [Sedimentisphaera salicampi]OXU15829.1 Ferrous-iron efflux pump FieF [Sedimentisphaera salicampi]